VPDGSAFLLIAGVAAGMIGSAGGITSLVTYPALLATGVPPLAANLTNSVALLGSGISSAASAKQDLVGHANTLKLWLAPMVLLSLGGAGLLIMTPSNAFDLIAPLLVLTGSIVLLSQPVIIRWQSQRVQPIHPVVVAFCGLVVAVYNGYFGAGSGIALTALLVLVAEPVVYRANALKNVILFASDVLPALLFSLSGSIAWTALWPLALGTLVGGFFGPYIARRVPPVTMRVSIGVCGIGLAAYLFLTP
jgi:uncharacterized protein